MPRGRPNQGPKIVALKKRGWNEAIFYIRWSEAGRSRERTTGTSDRGEAETFFGTWLIERAASTPGPIGPRYPAEAGIADMLALYAERHAPNLADPARVAYAIDKLLSFWVDRRVDAVRPETCRQYRRARAAGGVKEGTAAKELSILRGSLNWAVKNGYLISAPFVELPPRQPGKERWLSRGEVARLLWESRRNQKARLHLPLFILIAIYTGARHGAILGLRWSQVDLVAGRIDFNEPGQPRTNKRRPIISIPRGLRAALVRAHQRASSPWVITYEGKPIKRIRRAFDSACRRAGLTDVTRNTCRHTCGTWLAQAGVSLHQIAGWLGHTNTRTTELYAHHSPDHFGEARRAMERR